MLEKYYTCIVRNSRCPASPCQGSPCPYKLVVGIIKIYLGDTKLCVILLKLLTTGRTGLVGFVSSLKDDCKHEILSK